MWEWAEQNGDWAKLLVMQVVDKERTLTHQDRLKIYDLFLHSINIKVQNGNLNIKRPTLNIAKNDIKLKALTGITGVNKLAANQTLAFSNNITVIYGENGTGKTGYGRILKILGFCYEKDTQILQNVYAKTKVKQSATITYSVNTHDQEFTWNGENQKDCKELQSISIFNNNCVKLSIDAKRELLVTPIGFHLFTLLSNELEQLQTIHKSNIDNYDIEVSWADKLHEGTKVFEFISNLNGQSTAKELKQLGTFSEEDSNALNKLNAELKNLNKSLIENEIKTLRAQLKELQSNKTIVEEAKQSFTKELWKQYHADIENLQTLEKKKKVGLSEITKKRGVEFYDSEEFLSFIRAADDYLAILDKDKYPASEEETCLYCQQQLKDKEARELLKNYRLILNDTTQEDVKKLKRKLLKTEGLIGELESKIAFHQSSYGLNEDEKPIQPKFISDYNALVSKYKKLVSKGTKEDVLNEKHEIDFSGVIDKLNSKEKGLEEKVTEKKDTLAGLQEKENKLTKKINERKDAELLSKKVKATESIINNLREVSILNKHNSSFSTASISRRTSDARSNLVAENFNKIFSEELDKLRRSNIKVNLDFRTERGISKLVQYIESQYELSDVLSEGEQKSIALAEFLTELRLDKTIAPVIFDDPVTSLDHNIIDEVATRLVSLSKDRQVIIFTHSILLFNSIKQKSELEPFKKLQFKYIETEKDLQNTGYLHDSPDLKQETFKSYKSRINQILGSSKEDRAKKESELAIEGYNKLRASIEVLVEKDIFGGIVRRYRKDVALSKFQKVNGELIDKHKDELNSIFERCCGFTDAHSDPDELAQKPDLEGLKIDFEKVIKIQKEFDPNN